jgi:DNA-binding Lrp family transcriptional regulator
MDDLDRQLLSLLQQGIPIRPRPFEAVGRKLGVDEAETFLRIGKLRAQKLFERISGVLDGKKLGYKSTLVAMSLDANKLGTAAGRLCAHPGVGLSQVMEHELNFWFTLSLPGYCVVEGHLERLHELAESKRTLALPVMDSFKPHVKVSYRNAWRSGDRGQAVSDSPEFDSLDIEIIRLLQEDFPLCDEPFRRWAGSLGVTEEAVLAVVHRLIQRGCLKNIRAVLPLGRLDDHACLLVWEISEEKLEAIGRFVAHYNEVIHCVSRLAYPEFPYNLYAMLRTSAHMNWQDTAQKIEERIGQWPGLRFPVLESRRLPVRYFAHELEDWRELNPQGNASAGTVES